MRLSDADIEAALEEGRIKLTPQPDAKAISGISVDLRLSNSFRVFSNNSASFLDLSGDRTELNKNIDRVMGKEIIVEGDDAEDALAAIETLIEGRFNEDE